MRKALLLVALVLAGVTSAQLSKWDAPTKAKLELTGAVKTVSEYWQTATVSFGETVYSDRSLDFVFHFDEAGHVVAVDRPGPNGLWREAYRYGPNGQLLSVVSTGPAEPQNYTVQVTRPQPDQVVYDKYTPAGAHVQRVLYILDAQGRPATRARYGSDGEKIEEDRFTFDDAGHLTRYAVYFSDGLDHVETLAYGTQGWPVRDDWGLGVDRNVYPQVDARGNWTEERISAQSTSFGTTTWKPSYRVTREITYWR